MPYDPRPVSEGGNRGIDTLFTREPTKGEFRVVGLDTFDGTDWVRGDYPTLDEAKDIAETECAKTGFQKYFVYDKEGKCVASYSNNP